MGETIIRAKVRKTCALRQRQFKKWRKKGKNQVMQRQSHHLPPADQCPASLWATATLKKLLVLLMKMVLYDVEYLFGQFGSAVVAVSPPNLLPIPSLLVGENLWLCKCCSAVAKTFVCYQHCFGQNLKHSTIQATMRKVNSIPTRPTAIMKDKKSTTVSILPENIKHYTETYRYWQAFSKSYLPIIK